MEHAYGSAMSQGSVISGAPLAGKDPKPSLEFEMQHAASMIEALHHAISELESRLEPVLAPQGPHAVPPDVPRGGTVVQVSMAVAKANVIGTATQAAARRLGDILARLQL